MECGSSNLTYDWFYKHDIEVPFQFIEQLVVIWFYALELAVFKMKPLKICVAQQKCNQQLEQNYLLDKFRQKYNDFKNPIILKLKINSTAMPILIKVETFLKIFCYRIFLNIKGHFLKEY